MKDKTLGISAMNQTVKQMIPLNRWLNKDKRMLKILLCVFVVAYAALPIVWLAVRNNREENSFFECDFLLRYNEVQCLRSGFDPYDVWSGRVTSEEFRPYGTSNESSDSRKIVHAYVPWAYSYFYPFTLFPLAIAIRIYHGVNLFLGIMIVCYFLGYGYRKTGNKLDAFVVACFSTGVGICGMWLFISGNTSLLVTGAVLMMIPALERGHDKTAGLFWALAMIKIQMGALFFIPLLFSKKWKTIAVATICCLCASVFPAWLIGKSPVEMILNVRHIGAGYVSYATGGLFAFLSGEMPVRVILTGDFIVGLIGCAAASWWICKRTSDWVLRFMPTIITIPVWTYSQPYDRVIFILLLGWLMGQAFAITKLRQRLVFLCAYGVFAGSGLISWIMTQFVCRWNILHDIRYAVVDGVLMVSWFCAMLLVFHNVGQSKPKVVLTFS